ncbi:MAG: hypothetical protein IKT77_06515 [Paludibacteraceae bacterium]|nr:hypothetical protein [Paludibacteraceae bacterium]
MNWMLILNYATPIVATLSLCLNIGIIIYLWLQRKQRRDDIINIILTSQRFKDEINSIASFINLNNKKAIDKLKFEIIDEIRYLQSLDGKDEILSNKSNDKASKSPAQIQNVNQKIYYATATTEDNKNTFYRVTVSPEKESIFKLIEIQKGVCEFEIYDGAISLILKEKEYLSDSCLVEKTGNNKVITSEKGIAEQNIEGKWIIKKQAKIKIE